MPRVVLSTQVPDELLTPGSGGGDPVRNGRRQLPAETTLDPVQGSAAVWDDASNQEQPHRLGRSTAPSKPKFGAWYVPPDDWGQVFQPGGPDLHKEVSLAMRAGVGPGGKFPSGPEQHLQQAVNAQRMATREEDLRQTLSTAYTTRVYKEHLNANQLPEPAHLAGLAMPSEADIMRGHHHHKRPQPRGGSPGAAGTASHGPPTASPRTAQTLSPHAARQLPDASPVRGGGGGKQSMAAPQRPSISGGAPLVGRMSIKVASSPFQDMELDEIISPDMRAQVRKTLAMNDMLAQHAANMKKYYTSRRKQQALTTALKTRNLDPKSPGSGTTLTTEFLMATSPTQLHHLMTPGTGQHVIELVAAAHHLTTDGSLADVQYQPDSPAPLLELPRHMMAGRSVKFSEARVARQQQAQQDAAAVRWANGVHGAMAADDHYTVEDDQDDDAYGGQAGPDDLVWSDERSDDDEEDEEDREGEQGPGGAAQGLGVLQERLHTHTTHTMGQDIWDVPMLQMPGRKSPESRAAGAASRVNASCVDMAWDQLLEQQEAAQQQQVQGSVQVPCIDIPMPAEGSFLSDRSLTASDVLRHVPHTLLQQQPNLISTFLGHMHLPAEMQRQQQGGAFTAVPPGTAVAAAAAGQQGGSRGAPAPSQVAGQQGAGRDAVPSMDSRGPTPGTAPLAMHVLGCMAVKAKGLRNIAPIQEYRACNNHSAPVSRGLGQLTNTASSGQHMATANTPWRTGGSPVPAVGMHSEPMPKVKDAWVKSEPAQHAVEAVAQSLSQTMLPDACGGCDAQQPTEHKQRRRHHQQQQQQHQQHQHVGPDPQALPIMLGLMNLSLTYLAGDRVPRAGSRQALPPEARGIFVDRKPATAWPGERSRQAPPGRSHSSVGQQGGNYLEPRPHTHGPGAMYIEERWRGMPPAGVPRWAEPRQGVASPSLLPAVFQPRRVVQA